MYAYFLSLSLGGWGAHSIWSCMASESVYEHCHKLMQKCTDVNHAAFLKLTAACCLVLK